MADPHTVEQATHKLLKPFQIGYALDPNGCTAPELVSMWSSVLNDVGRASENAPGSTNLNAAWAPPSSL